MHHRRGHDVAADSPERGGDDWVDLGREDFPSSPTLVHDDSAGAGESHEHDEPSYDVLGADPTDPGQSDNVPTASSSGNRL